MEVDNALAVLGTSGIAWTLNNFGTVQATDAYNSVWAIDLSAGGTVLNGQSAVTTALIRGGGIGVFIQGGEGTVGNFGTIIGVGQEGVYLAAGGSVTNGQSGSSSGLISGYSCGVATNDQSSTTITNFGTIESTAAAPNSDGMISWHGGFVDNFGLIRAEDGSAVAILNSAGTVINAGTIQTLGTLGNGVGLGHGGSILNEQNALILARGTNASGVYLGGQTATLTNLGTIVAPSANYGAVATRAGGTITNGEAGSTTGLIEGGGAGIYLNAGGFSYSDIIVTNFGTIEGQVGLNTAQGDTADNVIVNFGTITGTGGTGIRLGNGNDRLIIHPGAVFAGTVDGGAGTNSIELTAGQGTGVLDGLGTNFTNFNSVLVDPGALWDLSGASTDHPQIANDGAISVTGTVLAIGALAADSGQSGIVELSDNATLELQNSVGATQTVLFADGTDSLILNAAGSFSGNIAGFEAGDTIELVGPTASAANYSDGVLTIQDGDTTVAQLTLSTPQSFPTFDVAPSSDGTVLTVATAPTIVSVVPSIIGGSDLNAGKSIAFTVNMNEPVTVNMAGGTPTLTLNDNEVASYTGGSGTSALSFAYTVQADDNIADLQVTGLSVPSGSGITDSAGNTANLASATDDTGIQIDTTPPTTTPSSLTIAVNSVAQAIGIAAPTDNLSSSLNIVVTGLPTDGTVYLADSTTPVSNGETLTSNQLTGLTFEPTPDRAGESGSFTYSVVDGAGNSTEGTATLSVVDTVSPGQFLVVSAGQSVSGAVVLEGAADYIVSGGITTATIVLSGGDEFVEVGGSASGTMVDGGNQVVYGAATSTVIDDGAYLYLESGTATGTVVNSGVELVAGIASATTDNSGGFDFVLSGGSVVSTTLDGGEEYIEIGATASTTVVNSAGAQVVYGAIDDTTLNSDTSAYLEPGSVASGVLVNGGLAVIYGDVSAVTVTGSGYDYVEVGGSTFGTVLSAGDEYVESGASTSSTVIDNGNQVIYGTTTATVINGGSFEYLYLGGTASGTVVNSGVESIFDLAIGTIVNSGGYDYINDGSASGTVVEGGDELVEFATSAVGTLVSGAGGGQFVYGTALSATLISGGEQVVEIGAVANATIADSGGEQDVESGGVTEDTIVQGGREWISAGGIASGTVLLGDRGDVVYGSSVATTISGGGEFVESGGSATGATVYSGAQAVEVGGLAVDTLVSGGTQYVYSGGTASGTTVDSAGEQYVEPGGAAAGAMISGGTVELTSGSITNGDMIGFAISGGGTLKLDDAVDFAGTVAEFGEPDQIDLADIAFGANTTLGFAEAGNNQSGTLTAGDGTHTANLTLLGQYATGQFNLAADGNGGTLLTDPPLMANANPSYFLAAASSV